MFTNNFDPVAFNILSIEIRWYSLAYIFGIIIGWYICKKKLSNDENLSKKFDDFIAFIIIGLIAGGRLGYVFFYNPVYFFNNPSEIIMIWNGGMSFHGAVLGIIIFNYIFIKKNNLKFFVFLDYICLVAPIGLFLGRIANFINSELYGKETDFLFSVNFSKIDQSLRHPSQLYEAFFEGVILFILLNFFFKRLKNTQGLISALFLIFYSIFRFLIEYFREPDAHLGYLIFNMTMGQLLSILFFIAGIIILNVKKADAN